MIHLISTACSFPHHNIFFYWKVLGRHWRLKWNSFSLLSSPMYQPALLCNKSSHMYCLKWCISLFCSQSVQELAGILSATEVQLRWFSCGVGDTLSIWLLFTVAHQCCLSLKAAGNSSLCKLLQRPHSTWWPQDSHTEGTVPTESKANILRSKVEAVSAFMTQSPSHNVSPPIHPRSWYRN